MGIVHIHIRQNWQRSEPYRPAFDLVADDGSGKVLGQTGPAHDAYAQAVALRPALRDAQPPAADAGAGMEVRSCGTA